MAPSNGKVDLVDKSVSDTSPHILLHPLVLVSQDDHGTRSNVRQQGAVIGAILGQHQGKEVSMEVSFECGSDKLVQNSPNGPLNPEWFMEMLELYGETFPSLNLVGWYTFGSVPTSLHAKIQLQLQQQLECASPIFLLYHWEDLNEEGVGGKLPFTLYESFSTRESGDMEVDDADESQSLKFRQLTYALETTEDEAIGLADIVHNATAAIAQTGKLTRTESALASKDKSGGADKDDLTFILTPEEEDTLAFLQSRSNAIKMLQSRLAVISAYLKAQPKSYLTDASTNPSSSNLPDHHILRSIAALETQLHLTSPEETVAEEKETTKTDVELITLLSSLTKSVQDMKGLTKKWGTVGNSKRKGTMSQLSSILNADSLALTPNQTMD